MFSINELYNTLIGSGILLFLIIMLVARGSITRIPIWSIMSFTAFITVISNLVNFDDLGAVIDMDVILFLIGMFSMVGLAESSGLLNAIAAWFISIFRRRRALIYGSSLLFGLLAAIAVNDTIALMGPPIAYTISRVAKIKPKMMFLLLAFSITIGSVMTPIGNPQNILIAIGSGMEAPFITFIYRLAIPTLLNLLITPYLLMKMFKVKEGEVKLILIPHEALRDRRDATLAAIGLALSIAILIINDILELLHMPYVVRKGFIPFIVAAGIYPFSSNPRKLIANVDWGTIIFFITMFVTMEGIWRSGVLTPLLKVLLSSKGDEIASIFGISFSSILLSQLISNVPFAKLFITYMEDLGYGVKDVDAWLTLAVASTIAGNLTILGAASNIIILEYLESKMETTIRFVEFLKYGSLVTIVNMIVYLPFLI
ncbi:MAG: SLC13 family permease [Nitrososphaerota archaeon]|nr:SLC13 family permease [Nitrososphaerales archaeon]MDW8045399.1 SLC13 family permease [Nitrososphaerota archaeon]